MTSLTKSSAALSPDVLIRKTLAANAVFCMASGLAMVIFSRQLGDWIGAPAATLLIVGLALIPWGALLWLFSRREAVRTAEAWMAVAGDELWVIGTLILVLGFPTALSNTGNAVVVLVAVVVAVFGAGGYLGIRRMRTEG